MSWRQRPTPRRQEAGGNAARARPTWRGSVAARGRPARRAARLPRSRAFATRGPDRRGAARRCSPELGFQSPACASSRRRRRRRTVDAAASRRAPRRSQQPAGHGVPAPAAGAGVRRDVCERDGPHADAVVLAVDRRARRCYVPLPLEPRRCAARLAAVLADADVEKIGHDLKRDLLLLGDALRSRSRPRLRRDGRRRICSRRRRRTGWRTLATDDARCASAGVPRRRAGARQRRVAAAAACATASRARLDERGHDAAVRRGRDAARATCSRRWSGAACGSTSSALRAHEPRDRSRAWTR